MSKACALYIGGGEASCSECLLSLVMERTEAKNKIKQRSFLEAGS